MSKFKNRAERNKDYRTEATEIFGKSKILVERPPEMSFEDYKMIKGFQDKLIRKMFPKAPLRKLMGVMKDHRPLLRINKGFTRTITQRKAS